MYLPLEGSYPSVGEVGANGDHKIDLTPKKVLSFLEEQRLLFEIMRIEERKEEDEYSFDFVVRKL